MRNTTSLWAKKCNTTDVMLEYLIGVDCVVNLILYLKQAGSGNKRHVLEIENEGCL